MKNIKVIGFWFVALGLLLTACTGRSASPQNSANILSQTGNDTTSAPSATPNPPKDSSSTDLARTDSQGAVAFEVKPVNLDNPAGDLIFDISMNTHSVDLSMNLASLATLTTDTGATVQGIHWDGAKGGHHVQGKLTFPATYDGKPLLAGARQLTLTIKNVDAPIRLFTWQLAN